jgi:mono/diheme cytochrome c family protein
LVVCVVVGCGLFGVSGQESRPSVFTAGQAQAGKVAYEQTCVRCHTTSLLGRKGAAGELPPLESLSASDQEFIKKFGPVPALAGPAFFARWKDKTAAQTIARINEAVRAFPPAGRNDQTAVEITAYALQVSGAKAGDRSLTTST